jgi:glutathione synthase/RimK-type ligase-like ATP-grasp enzyme
MTSATPDTHNPAQTPFLGLAPFLRMSIAGTDLQPVAQALLAQAQSAPHDANLWMNLSLSTLCLGQREVGLALQAQALDLQRVYHLPAAQQPAKLRLLMLVTPGDLAANTPLECLLENSDIDLDLCFIREGDPWTRSVPEHDVLIVAVGEADEHHALLKSLEPTLASWHKPVVNAPAHILSVGRARASALLQDAPGLFIPPTEAVSRQLLQAVANGSQRLGTLFHDCDFPVIVRPAGSHGGHDLDKIDSPEHLGRYLERVDAPTFYLSRFIDYRDPDGLFRKYRIALIDGAAFACHMAVSSQWMVHYVNAGMYEDASKRAEEAHFMAHFADFLRRHEQALAGIAQRIPLDYLCIDCAQTAAGELLVFEVDHAMVVHAMDSEALFPFKQTHMHKVKSALREYLLRRVALAGTADIGTAAAQSPP